MQTEIAKIEIDETGSIENYDAIVRAGQIIRAGGLVAFPTETVYGLGGNALFPDAAKKIYAAKGRPSDNPLIIHIAELESLTKLTDHIPDEAIRLAEAFWCGPLTMILKKSAAVPFETTGGLDTVAIREPSHPVALALIREGGGFIAAPSANTSGRPSPTKASHVAEDLSGKIEMILDGGDVAVGLESTIIDLTEEIPTILRPGAVTLEMLKSVLGEVRIDPGLIDEASAVAPKAPGMKYRHYAPKAEMLLIEGEASRVTEKINALAAKATSNGRSVGILSTEEAVDFYPKGTVLSLGKREREDEIARHLYDALRRFDELKVDVIYAEGFSDAGLSQAIQNRLLKAAGHQVITV